MNVLPVPPIPQFIVDQMEALIQSGVGQQQVIAEMRAAGLHIGYCIKLTTQLYGISLGDAKRMVHFSDAWADMRERHDALHDRAFEAARQAGFEEVEESVALRSAS